MTSSRVQIEIVLDTVLVWGRDERSLVAILICKFSSV